MLAQDKPKIVIESYHVFSAWQQLISKVGLASLCLGLQRLEAAAPLVPNSLWAELPCREL